MITVNDLKNRDNFFLMAGPCAIEGEDMALRIAEKVVGITNKLNIPYIFKGSYRKANRSRLDSFTGIGDEKALKILRRVGGYPANPCFPLPADGPAGSCCQDKENCQYQKRTVPLAGSHAICRTKSSRCRK